MIQVKQASFAYATNTPLFQDLSFVLPRGSILAILGPNGVGKSTLLKCTVGLLPWTSGASYLDDQPIRDLPPKKRWAQIGYIPQKRSFRFDDTGLEMVVLGAANTLGPWSRPAPKEYQKAKETMESLGIAHLQNQLCSTMSGGELQMIIIARGLVAEPDYLLLDEPEAGLDFKNQLKIVQLLHQLAHEQNLGIIYNTHHPNYALRIADQGLLLGRQRARITGPTVGRQIPQLEDSNMERQPIHLYGPIQELLTQENMQKIFGVDALLSEIHSHNKNYPVILPLEVREE